MQNLINELKASVESKRGELRQLADYIWENPETAFKEVKACAAQVELLKKAGFEPATPVYEQPTAYRVEVGEGSPVFCIAAEYDALPEVGHGCGHNLICTASIGAFLAATTYMKTHGIPGKLVLLGTPAEESGSGKVRMLAKGCLDGVDAVMMLHPGWRTSNDTGSTAIRRFDVEFHGKAAHAAGMPEDGINALDAVHLLFDGVNCYRQQMPEFTRIHGIVTNGGAAPNIIPEKASARFFLRSNDEAWEDRLVERFKKIVEGAALMTGTTYTLTPFSISCQSRMPNAPMNAAYIAAAEQVGLKPFVETKAGRGSSDFGNFSHACPGVHCYFGISEKKIPGHSIEMAEAAHSDYGFENTLRGAVAMAAVAIRFMQDGDFRTQVTADFKANSPH
ncbi:MAG: M20 family metallopeptidase [Victivallales bacterium]|nr:M20 family metallopeptidase [Victivallales bacterium]